MNANFPPEIITREGLLYRKIANDLEFEIALSSESLGFCYQDEFYTSAVLKNTYQWREDEFRFAHNKDSHWYSYICIGTDEDNH